MSSRLFVTRILDRAKVIKKWYAKVVPSNITIAELFSRLRGGEIDGVPVDKGYLGCQVNCLIFSGFFIIFISANGF